MVLIYLNQNEAPKPTNECVRANEYAPVLRANVPNNSIIHILISIKYLIKNGNNQIAHSLAFEENFYSHNRIHSMKSIRLMKSFNYAKEALPI